MHNAISTHIHLVPHHPSSSSSSNKQTNKQINKQMNSHLNSTSSVMRPMSIWVSNNVVIPTLNNNTKIQQQLQPTNDDDQNNDNNNKWHWEHYHEPYNFGAKPPNFHDYADLMILNTTKIGQQQQQQHYGNNRQNTITTNNLNHSAQLSCDSGEMVLRLNFSDSFKGIVYPDHNRLSPCRFFGDGHHNYELRLPLRGCGTRQVSPLNFSSISLLIARVFLFFTFKSFALTR